MNEENSNNDSIGCGVVVLLAALGTALLFAVVIGWDTLAVRVHLDELAPSMQRTGIAAQPPAAGNNQAHPANEKIISGDGFFGCVSKEYEKSLVGYAVENDREAYRSALQAGIFAGTCTVFKKGEVVYLEDVSLPGLIRVRRKGQTQAYWTIIEAVK